MKLKVDRVKSIEEANKLIDLGVTHIGLELAPHIYRNADERTISIKAAEEIVTQIGKRVIVVFDIDIGQLATISNVMKTLSDTTYFIQISHQQLNDLNLSNHRIILRNEPLLELFAVEDVFNIDALFLDQNVSISGVVTLYPDEGDPIKLINDYCFHEDLCTFKELNRDISSRGLWIYYNNLFDHPLSRLKSLFPDIEGISFELGESLGNLLEKPNLSFEDATKIIGGQPLCYEYLLVSEKKSNKEVRRSYYYEIDTMRQETRRIEAFHGGRHGINGFWRAIEENELSDLPLPTMREYKKLPHWKAVKITKADFERYWFWAKRDNSCGTTVYIVQSGKWASFWHQIKLYISRLF